MSVMQKFNLQHLVTLIKRFWTCSTTFCWLVAEYKQRDFSWSVRTICFKCNILYLNHLRMQWTKN